MKIIIYKINFLFLLFLKCNFYFLGIMLLKNYLINILYMLYMILYFIVALVRKIKGYYFKDMVLSDSIYFFKTDYTLIGISFLRKLKKIKKNKSILLACPLFGGWVPPYGPDIKGSIFINWLSNNWWEMFLTGSYNFFAISVILTSIALSIASNDSRTFLNSEGKYVDPAVRFKAFLKDYIRSFDFIMICYWLLCGVTSGLMYNFYVFIPIYEGDRLLAFNELIFFSLSFSLTFLVLGIILYLFRSNIESFLKKIK